MCSCNNKNWTVTPPSGTGRKRSFTTEAQARDYAAKFPGAQIKPPKGK